MPPTLFGETAEKVFKTRNLLGGACVYTPVYHAQRPCLEKQVQAGAAVEVGVGKKKKTKY
jgi:hypothetical protein